MVAWGGMHLYLLIFCVLSQPVLNFVPLESCCDIVYSPSELITGF